MTSVTPIRRLSPNGLERFWSFIDQCRQSGMKGSYLPTVPIGFVIGEDSVDMAAGISLDLSKTFANRFEFAKYVSAQIGANWKPDLEYDVGFWAWLAAAHWKQFVGNKVRRQEHYIPALGEFSGRLGYQRIDYRHCARTPVMLYRKFGDDCRLFLVGTSNRPRTMSEMGDFIEQILSRQDVYGNPKVIEVLRSLYQDENGFERVGSTADPKVKKLKSGKWSTSGRGGARRLVMGVLPRLKLTYNVAEMAPERIVELAGPEFQSFASRA